MRIGNPKAKNVITILSGIHGVEGYAGSAFQTQFLDKELLENPELMENIKEGKTSVLIIHAINPWGFSNNRRVNEDNVDVNRNWPEEFGKQNPVYEEFSETFVPKNWNIFSKAKIIFEYLKAIKQGRLKEISKATTEGNSDRDGVYYYGDKPSWSRITLEKILKKHFIHAKNITYLDIHSGLGKSKELPIVLPEYFESSPEFETIKKFFGHAASEVIPTEDTAMGGNPESTNTGYLTRAPFIKGKNLYAASIEYGTVDSITLFLAMCEEASMFRKIKQKNPSIRLSKNSKTYKRFLEAQRKLKDVFYPQKPKEKRIFQKSVCNSVGPIIEAALNLVNELEAHTRILTSTKELWQLINKVKKETQKRINFYLGNQQHN